MIRWCRQNMVNHGKPSMFGFQSQESSFWYQINRTPRIGFEEFRNDQLVFFVSRSYERAPVDQNLYTVLCATSKPACWRPLKWVRGHGSGLDSRPQPRECCWAAALNQYSMDCLDMHMFNSVKTKQPHKLFKLWMHVPAFHLVCLTLLRFSSGWDFDSADPRKEEMKTYESEVAEGRKSIAEMKASRRLMGNPWARDGHIKFQRMFRYT